MAIDKYIKHTTRIAGTAVILLLCMVYPFFSGGYDHLAMPLSILVQIFGLVGLPLSMLGLMWFMAPKRRFIFVNLSLFAGIFVMLILSLFAMLGAGYIFGIMITAAWVYVVICLKAKLKNLKPEDLNHLDIVPLYLIALPVLIFVIQLVLLKPVKHWSRNKVITNAKTFISHIEDYHKRYGRYPLTLQAMYKDYYTQVVGIEKYHYLPNGDSYNLSFEQPRFILDNIGTREWVVYNPRDEHRVYSHTSWFLLLSPEELEQSQGWYASGETGHAHWKYFLFD